MNILNKIEFERLLSENGKIVADFYADWCGPCSLLAPVLEELSAAHSEAEFVKLNVDEVSELAERYGIDAIPCVIAFENGRETARSVGFCGSDELVRRLGL